MFIFYNAFRQTTEIRKAIFWKDSHQKKLLCLLSNTLGVEGLIGLGDIYLLLLLHLFSRNHNISIYDKKIDYNSMFIIFKLFLSYLLMSTTSCSSTKGCVQQAKPTNLNEDSLAFAGTEPDNSRKTRSDAACVPL